MEPTLLYGSFPLTSGEAFEVASVELGSPDTGH